MKIVCQNKKAYHDYHLFDKYEAGMVLKGSEVKSLRGGSVSLKECYVRIKDGEAFLIDSHIARYPQAGEFGHEPKRNRKLLLKKREIERLLGKVQQKGFTIIPLRIYFKNGFAKVEFALAKGKREYSKKEEIKKKEAEREIEREMRRRR